MNVWKDRLNIIFLGHPSSSDIKKHHEILQNELKDVQSIWMEKKQELDNQKDYLTLKQCLNEASTTLKQQEMLIDKLTKSSEDSHSVIQQIENIEKAVNEIQLNSFKETSLKLLQVLNLKHSF